MSKTTTSIDEKFDEIARSAKVVVSGMKARAEEIRNNTVHKFPGSIRIVPTDHSSKVADLVSIAPVVRAVAITTNGGGPIDKMPTVATSDFSAFLGTPEMVFPGICMSDVARDTGLTVGGVSRIFNGLRKAKKHTIKSIANLYHGGDMKKVVEAIRQRVILRVKTDDRQHRIDPNRQKRLEIVKAYDESRY